VLKSLSLHRKVRLLQLKTTP